ncbi:phage replication-related protein YjqB (UPF0714/DUF867 family) [Melghirimyces profundicolus]|uniref:Phage replication-related protein YjqB (UPF0714/DUF867 family) n=1 Tax=Melghirimyces profundicolus TaxID=1242148 RepID=A0A2T6BS33_9BACL|nr:poly-gamma-glutamate hydrolase family protein [Melghirimyces profundicolus]PTX58903.1 phage replication-related protein YjqB (UPF0714/DUF867 family) [Melghirimyces profundicolus]
MSEHYSSYAELAEQETEGIDYRIEMTDRSVAILAIHGGNIEFGTSDIARRMAGEDYSLYLFEGLKPSGNRQLHLTSTRFDEPRALQLVRNAGKVITVHGCGGLEAVCYVGGRDTDLRDRILEKLRKADFQAEVAPPDIAGTHPENICNQGTTGAGVQLELTRTLRDQLFEPEFVRDRLTGRQRNLDRFVKAVRSALSSTE